MTVENSTPPPAPTGPRRGLSRYLIALVALGFVALLVYVMLALALSMSGVVAFGASWGGLGHTLTEDEGVKGAFFTGVLACVVASPCTAPFMGVALGAAFTLPAALTLVVIVGLLIWPSWDGASRVRVF